MCVDACGPIKMHVDAWLHMGCAWMRINPHELCLDAHGTSMEATECVNMLDLRLDAHEMRMECA